MDVSFKKAMRKARPSPAMVVAFVALLAALGGTAGALSGKNGVDNNDIKKNAVDSANIVKNGVTGDDAKESTFGEVPSADNGVQGYALIDGGTATVDPASPSLNITNANVTSGGVGEFCFNGLPFTPRSVVATGDAVGGNAAQDNFFAAANIDGGACPGVEQASVESRDDDDTAPAALQNADFYIVFF